MNKTFGDYLVALQEEADFWEIPIENKKINSLESMRKLRSMISKKLGPPILISIKPESLEDGKFTISMRGPKRTDDVKKLILDLVKNFS